MKILLTILILAAGYGLAAQPVALRREEAASKGILNKLNEDYKNPEASARETPFSIQKAIQGIYEKILTKNSLSHLTFWNTLYLNADGKIDYLVFDVGSQSFRIMNGKPETPRGADSVAAVIASKITPYLSDIVSRRTAGARATLVTFVSFHNPAPKEPQPERDSVVNGLAQALAVRDTLKIKSLGLAQSLLTRIPDVIYRFPNLEQLYLTDNDIEKVYLDMARLPKLKDVDLTRNILTENSIVITKNKSLKLLNLQSNMIRDIPSAARNCKKLETLWLGNNKLTGLNNASFKKLKSVKDLNFYKAGVPELPKGIRKMRRLEVLDLYYNQLELLPRPITRLKRLTHLAISHNQLTELPARIDKLKRVHTVFAHHNHLSKLPDRITRMQELRILDLGYNWLTTFPAQVVALNHLQELDLSANNFPEFPMQLLQIRKLDKLHLRGNPFLGADAEHKYSDQLSQLKKKNIEVFY